MKKQIFPSLVFILLFFNVSCNFKCCLVELLLLNSRFNFLLNWNGLLYCIFLIPEQQCHPLNPCHSCQYSTTHPTQQLPLLHPSNYPAYSILLNIVINFKCAYISCTKIHVGNCSFNVLHYPSPFPTLTHSVD